MMQAQGPTSADVLAAVKELHRALYGHEGREGDIGRIAVAVEGLQERVQFQGAELTRLTAAVTHLPTGVDFALQTERIGKVRERVVRLEVIVGVLAGGAGLGIGIFKAVGG